MRFEQWLKMRTVLGMSFKEIDDRCGINQEEGLVRQIIDSYRSHSSRSLRTVWELSLPHNPRPVPAKGNNGSWRTAEPYASIGTNAATGLPWRVMIVERPFSAAISKSGSWLRASSAPLRTTRL